MSRMEVADDPMLLERLEVPVDGGEIERGPIKADGDLLGGDGATDVEEEVDDHASGRRDPQAAFPQGAQHGIRALELDGGACRLDGQNRDETSRIRMRARPVSGSVPQCRQDPSRSRAVERTEGGILADQPGQEDLRSIRAAGTERHDPGVVEKAWITRAQPHRAI
jgi:hypothetical protein